MDLELTHKHVPVTGDSKGIGLACARTFLAEGARVALVPRAQENLLAAQSALLKDASGAAVDIVGSGGKVAAVTHLAAAYASKGVRVNAVNPSLTRTERLHEGMQPEARHLGISIEEALIRAKATRPLGRTAEPSEIADAVVYLASNRASYITGALAAMEGAVTPMVVWGVSKPHPSME